MTKCCLIKEVWEVSQFCYIDGIDGPKTCKKAAELGLSRNEGHSLLWEIKCIDGWKIVNSGDRVLSANRGFHGEKVYTVLSQDQFSRTMWVFNSI